jgi:hypothetical protein
MALPVLHLCQFNFQTQDVRIVGSEIDGGTAISGISEPTQTDGGGYWLADYSNGNFGNRDEAGRKKTLAWRALMQLFSGGRRLAVRFCDRWNQPVNAARHIAHSDGTPFSDDTTYESSDAVATVTAVINGETDGLNATIIEFSFAAARPLIGGERFTHVHATWLDRCYQIETLSAIDDGYRVAFLPGIRGGIAVGDPLDFNDPRCVMRRVSQPSNAINLGIFAQNMSLQLVEDMRQPVSA